MNITILKVYFLFFFITINTFSQNEISVEVDYALGTTNERITKTDKLKVFKGVEYKLIANHHNSLFNLVEKMDSDVYRRNSLYTPVNKLGGSVYYHNTGTGEKALVGYLSTDASLVLISYPFEKRKWELLAEKKEIAGYQCYKAVYTLTHNYKGKHIKIRDYIAWYTPEIPIPFGPEEFVGLPGLVLEASREDYHFIAKKIKFNKNKKVKKPKKYKQLTEKEHNEYIENNFTIDKDSKVMKRFLKEREENLKILDKLFGD